MPLEEGKPKRPKRDAQPTKSMKALINTLFLFAFALQAQARLDDSWSVAVGGQQVRVAADGSFVVPNITTPDRFGPSGSGSAPDFVSDDFVRLTGYKTNINGASRYVWSQPFQLRNRETFVINDSDLSFSDTPLVEPEYVRVTAPKTLLRALGETVQLITTAISPDSTPELTDNPTEDVTPRSKFTIYRSSNPAILTVAPNGLATARGNGTVIVTAVNSMVSGSLQMEVNTNRDTTVEGFVRNTATPEAAVQGATVTIGSRSATTDANGKFVLTSIPITNPRLLVTVTKDFSVLRSVEAVPDGISDAGIIRLGGVTNQGNEFIVLFQKNYQGSATQQIYISSSRDTFGTVESPGIATPISFNVTAGVVTKVDIPSSLMVTSNNTIENKGIRVITNDPVQIYGLSQLQFTTDAYAGIPVKSLGTQHLVMSYGSLSGTQFAVVATQDATSVTIIPKASVSGRPANTSFTITLNRLQTFQLLGTTSGIDLTGSSVTATKPIALFGGHSCANVPTGTTYCDHIIEQIPPVTAWGTQFITVPLATRTAGDIIRVLASENATDLEIVGTVNTTNHTLLAGGFVDVSRTDVCRINATKPVLVAQYCKGGTADGTASDPFMMIIPPSEQFLQAYIFSTPTNSNITSHYVNIVALTADVQDGAVALDGAIMATGDFTAIPDSIYSYARRSLAQGDHSISSANPFGIYVYGFGNDDSYGYPGGFALDKINP